MAKKYKYFKGCDEDCFHCPYPDCAMPSYRAPRGLDVDYYIKMRDGIPLARAEDISEEVGERRNYPKHIDRRRVVCIETGAVYDTIKAAAAATGICKSSISNCLNKIYSSAGGYHWMREAENNG